MSSWCPPRRVVQLGLAMIAAHVAFRAWVASGAWFYLDDYRLVDEAGRHGFTSLLLEPYDAQLMPFGRAVAWAVAQNGTLHWPLLAAISVTLAALAALSCLWLLLTLFGPRPGVLAVLALYLTTATTLPAFTWWAAGLNQLPLQSVFFVAVAAWVRFLRGEGRRWLVVLLAALLFGLACYIKTLLVLPALVFVAFGYFTSGGPVRRSTVLLQRHAAVIGGAVALGVGWLVLYTATVPQITTRSRSGAAEVAEAMIGRSLASGLLGGPWRWDDQIAPVGQAAPPALLVHVCWVVLTLVVGYTMLRRQRTGRAWAFLAGWVAADYLLLLTTRAQVVGAVSGTEYRYLTDAMCAVVLAVGLATMELRGADEGARARATPLLTVRVGTTPVAIGLAVVCVGGLVSSASYARTWHDRHPGHLFLANTLADLDGQRRVDLAGRFLPAGVSGALDARYNSADVLLPLLSPIPRFPDVTGDLHVITDDGHVVPARLDVATAIPPGPVAGCGWALRGGTSRGIALDGPTLDVGWWLRIDYLASGDSGLSVSAGDTTRQVDLLRGLHQAWVRVEGSFAEVRLGGVDDGVTICIDAIAVGTPVATDGEG